MRKKERKEDYEPIQIKTINIHPNTNTIQTTMIPPDYKPDSNVFCYTSLANKQEGKLYTDATGALPAFLMGANQYDFVAYDYNNNYIFAESIINVKDDTIIAAFQHIFAILVEKGH